MRKSKLCQGQDRRSSSLAGRSEFTRSSSAMPALPLSRRSQSQSVIHDPRFPVSPLPPVPRVPSVYSSGLNADASEREQERGRTRYSATATAPPPASSAFLPPSTSVTSDDEFPIRKQEIPPEETAAETHIQAPRKRSQSKLRKPRQNSIKDP